MRDGLTQQAQNTFAQRTRPRRVLELIAPGGILTATTIVLSAVNAVSPQQSVALALPAAVLTIGGLLGAVVPDAWTAWRRGFKVGCQAGLQAQTEPAESRVREESVPCSAPHLCCRDSSGAVFQAS